MSGATVLATFNITGAHPLEPRDGATIRSTVEVVEHDGSEVGDPVGIFVEVRPVTDEGEQLAAVWARPFSTAGQAMAVALDLAGFNPHVLASVGRGLGITNPAEEDAEDEEELHDIGMGEEVGWREEWADITFTADHPCDDGYHATLGWGFGNGHVVRLTYDCGHGPSDGCEHTYDVVIDDELRQALGLTWRVRRTYAEDDEATAEAAYGPVMLVRADQVKAVHIY